MSLSAPSVVSIRNSTIIQHFDTSCIDFDRKGNVNALKQNLDSPYKEKISDLSKSEILPKEFENINDYYTAYDREYFKHKFHLLSTNIELKELGTLSNNQMRTVRKAVENMVNTVLLNHDKRVHFKDQPNLTFVTLTLPIEQKHTDKVFRKLLVRFIENLIKTYQVKHYVWKAEPQKNGNIHFHLIIDRWVAKEKIQNLWNRQLDTIGYIDAFAQKRKKEGFIYRSFFYRKGVKILSKLTEKEQYKNYLYNKSIGFRNPPTVKIQGISKAINKVAYVLKYMTKPEFDKRQIIGKIWGCANITKKLEYPRFYDSEVFYDEVRNLVYTERFNHLVKDEYINVYVGKVFGDIAKYCKKTWLAIKHHYNLMNQYTTQSFKDFIQNDEALKNKALQPVVVDVIKKIIPKKPKEPEYYYENIRALFGTSLV